MAGGHMKYRHLSRKSSHRKALLRNLVTSLIKNETIHTTWHKAKEAQRLAEKLITLGKRNTNASRRGALSILFEPHTHLPKLFGELRERYASRPGGYTRILRTEPKKDDQAPSAILELVDGPKDMRFHLTAKTIVTMREMQEKNVPIPAVMQALTEKNVAKVTRFRPEGKVELKGVVKKFEEWRILGRENEVDGTVKVRANPVKSQFRDR